MKPKPALQWQEELAGETSTESIEQIQLDAYRAGMLKDWHVIRDEFVDLIRSGVEPKPAFDQAMTLANQFSRSLTQIPEEEFHPRKNPA